MARNRILLMLAAIAVGLLVLGTIVISDPTHRVHGPIYKSHGLTNGYMDAHLDPVDTLSGGQVVPATYISDSTWIYEFLGVGDGSYNVWARYEDSLEICISSKYPVTVSGDDEVVPITIYSYQCQDKP